MMNKHKVKNIDRNDLNYHVWITTESGHKLHMPYDRYVSNNDIKKKIPKLIDAMEKHGDALFDDAEIHSV